MNIRHENVPGLIQSVVFEINKQDYTDNLEAALKKQRRHAQIPGFRPGNAPAGMIRRMYGKSLLIEEIDRLLFKEMDEYFKADKIKIIFEPLPDIENTRVDFDNPNCFEFAYQYVLAPEFVLDYENVPVIQEFKFIPDDTQINRVIDGKRHEFGKYVEPETVEATDNVSVKYDENCNGLLAIKDLKEEARASFTGKKMNDVVNISLQEAFDTKENLARFLKIDPDKLEKDNPYRYDLTILHIGRLEPATLDETFFKKAFPDDSVKNEDDLRNWASNQVTESFKPDMDRQLLNDISSTLIRNVNIEIPEDFMVRYLLEVQKKATKEDIEQNIEKYVDSFKWQLIEHHITDETKIAIAEDDIRDYFRDYFKKAYFAQFDPEAVKESIEKLVEQALENDENKKSAYNILFDRRLLSYLRTKLNLEVIEGNLDDFIKFVGKQQAAAKATKATDTENATDTDKTESSDTKKRKNKPPQKNADTRKSPSDAKSESSNSPASDDNETK